MIQETQLQKLLLGGSQPRFKNQTELAKLIREEWLLAPLPDGSPPPKLESLRSYLNQVLRNHRPASGRLRGTVESLAAQKLRSGEDEGAVRAELSAAFDGYSSKVHDSPDRVAFYAATETARHQVISTFVPAEILAPSGPAKGLVRDLAQRTGLVTEPPERPTRYEFYMSRRDIAEFFWKKLVEFVCEEEPDGGLKKLRELSERKELPIEVFVLPPTLCLAPMVVFDPDSARPSGFVLFHHEQEEMSLCRMSDSAVTRWKSLFYVPLQIRGSVIIKEKTATEGEVSVDREKVEIPKEFIKMPEESIS